MYILLAPGKYTEAQSLGISFHDATSVFRRRNAQDMLRGQIVVAYSSRSTLLVQ